MNIFKSNTRVKNISESDENYYSNSFKNTNSKTNQNENTKYSSSRFKTENKEPIKKEFVMEESAFPELNKPTVKSLPKDKDNDKTFANLLTNNVKTEPTLYVEKHNPNLTIIRIDKKTSNMTITHGKEKVVFSEVEENEIISTKILNKLTDSYVKWTDNFIETWGQEAYIDRYVCPNYDAHYFDKLDELYETELQKEWEQEQIDFINEHGENYEYHEYQSYYD
jgi:hypothetical protein